MKRERLEDLGRVYELLRQVLEEDSVLNECTSKHSIDDFIMKYKHEERLGDLHDWLRFYRERLYDILIIAGGEDED